jgi:hypothetical protein
MVSRRRLVLAQILAHERARPVLVCVSRVRVCASWRRQDIRGRTRRMSARRSRIVRAGLGSPPGYAGPIEDQGDGFRIGA